MISFEHSLWWLLLAIPAASVLVWWVYFQHNSYADLKLKLKAILVAARWLVLIALVILLLAPFIQQSQNEEEKPLLIVADDISLSVPKEDQLKLTLVIRNASASLGEKFDIKYLPFAEHIEDTQAVFYTDYENLLKELGDKYYNLNIGALVVGTDGIRTLGANPKYVNVPSNAPLFTYALGDSALTPDAEISEVLNNRLVFIDNDFEIKVRVQSAKLNGRDAELKLMKGDQQLDKKSLKLNGSTQEFSFITKARSVGLNRFEINLTIFNEELNKINNKADAFIEVLDNRTKVLLLAKHPHPDIAAIDQALGSSDQYEINKVLIDQWDGKTNNVDLAILHGIPENPADLDRVKAFRESQIPVFSVITSRTNATLFNRLDLGIEIENSRNRTDETGGALNEEFNLFKVPESPDLERFPPLQTLFGEYKLTGENQSILFQKIGPIKTEKPLFSFSSKTGWKRAVLAGEGWWEWRIFASMQFDSHWPDELILKTVQYLALKQKRNKLSISAPKKISEGSEAKFEGEFYNESYELVNDIQLDLQFSDSLQQSLDYTFKSEGKGYKLNLGRLAPGTYKWKATAQYNGVLYTEVGEMSVVKNNAEFAELIADYALLEQWSSQSNGRTFYSGQEEELLKTLEELDTAKTIIHTTKIWKKLISWKWLCFLLVLLATTEWILRKLHGYY